MVSVFTREITDNLASLVKHIDKSVGNPTDKEKQSRALVVLLSEDLEGDAAKLEALAEKHGIKNTPLTIFDGVAGPPKYQIAEEADVTVVMWADKKVEVTHAFRQGDFDKAAVAKVVADAQTVLQPAE